MNPKHNSGKLNEFFKNYEEKNPALILGLTLCSLGLYSITWIYKINRDLEDLDDDAPDSTRGMILLAVFPFTWFFVTTLIKEFVTSSVFVAIELIVYFFIYILAIKYLYEFCEAFSHVTRTRTMIWFLPFLLGTVGFLGYFLQSIVVASFIVVLFLMIPAMQSELNTTYHKISIKKNNYSLYS